MSNGYPLSGRLIDPRDAPQPSPGSDPYDYQLDPAADPSNRAPELEAVTLARELPIMHGHCALLFAQTVLVGTSPDALPNLKRLGLQPSRVQAHMHIAYSVVWLANEAQLLVGPESAAGPDYYNTFGAPFLNAAGASMPDPIILPGVAGVWVRCSLVGVVKCNASIAVFGTTAQTAQPR